ncbi:MAG: hypothetical protein COU08_01020 [Candidatus Harrisonbacteria bacterium CG10_big_fil_rev_8_21_14_0_10_42_17]|uniref:YebC/PmpR family DNA-binding transcriptional regulator n=1 Tax=Candidatus Harrisonbacteria bacterium CG10_big_fil_rev_8_21_14_0_10_42_17 TaxID=1974584 RepID=A0A2M6WIV4_9BACT|nr:MAG: hypothetical protein COU08_01020 [Candidatus Harrisonbacteria bacterium CG10_big_fil_rev_8_21_14_0_10_42_17]
MSGHSHWKQIQHKKGAADKKRGVKFTKLLKAIQIAARNETNPDFNPTLKDAIRRAKEGNVPNDTIERAITKSSEVKNLKEVVFEAYGPGGAALIIEAITDNNNRTVSELKRLLSDYKAKLADPGSVLWAFEKKDGAWHAGFMQSIEEKDKQLLIKLIEALNDHDDVQQITTNGK